MHVDEVLWHGEDRGTALETLHRCCVMRKVIRREVVARGRFDFFLRSETSYRKYVVCIDFPLI